MAKPVPHQMIIDSHLHLFNEKIIASVIPKKAMIEKLNLQTGSVQDRMDICALEKESEAADIIACLALPTASAQSVRKTNRFFIKTAQKSPLLFTAGTLHPGFSGNREELIYLNENGVKGIKLCSFSQRFSLNSSNTYHLFDLISEFNEIYRKKHFVILDTFYLADHYFGTAVEQTTTPKGLATLVERYPQIDFIAAHMGGLCAPFQEIHHHLTPRPNLFLDTSNATHTLKQNEFVCLLQQHGPEHILFGTDWPWFNQATEANLVSELMDLAGYTENEKSKVFYQTISRFLGHTH